MGCQMTSSLRPVAYCKLLAVGPKCKAVNTLACKGEDIHAVQITFLNGSQLAVHYFVIPELHAHVAAFGDFQAKVAYFDPGERGDPFGRTDSVMPWDREDEQHVLQDPR